MGNKVVRVVKAYESQIVEIEWCLNDNSVFTKRYTVPPKSVRDYVMNLKGEAKNRNKKCKRNKL